MYEKRKTKKLPIGISNFEKVIREDYYYIDKSLMIHELCDQGTNVTLFTRPRRFGKTLNMMMLKEFFDIQKNSSELFKELKIANSPYYEEMNGYPTLFFSFRESKGEKDVLLMDMFSNIRNEYRKYAFMVDSLEEFQKSDFQEILDILNKRDITNTVIIATSIRFLVEIISKYYNKPVILLIDEYDTPMENAYVEGYYEELRSFFRMLYASVLKDNEYLKMGILTGIQRIAKENIFSGLNNLEVNTVKSTGYGEYFGLGVEETRELLQAYGLSVTEDVTAMYNGYNFGGHEIYNPWSVLNYVKNKVLQPFWINTASSQMIKDRILNSNQKFREGFERLITDGTVSVILDMNTAYAEETSTATLWGLLLNAGYITLVDTNGDINRVAEEIRIPNREVKSEFERIMESYINVGDSNLAMMFHELIYKEDIVAFQKIYQQMVLKATSYYDAKENAYHMLFLGMCCYLDAHYEVKSNIETGTGRCDIMLRAKKPHLKHFIIEFKEGEDVEQLAIKAIEQIEEKQYGADLKGAIVLMGVAHHKKICQIISKEIVGTITN